MDSIAAPASTTSVKSVPHLDPPIPYAPLAGVSEGGLPRITLPSGHAAVHLTRYADVHRVLTDPTFSRTRANTDGGPGFLPVALAPELLITLDVPHHARMRGALTADYSPAAIEKLRPTLDEAIDERFAALRAQERPDLFRTVIDLVPAMVNCRFLGIPTQHYIDSFRPYGHTVQMGRADDVPTLVDHFVKLYDYVTDVVTGARPTDADGLAARLAAGRDRNEPPLTDKELVGLLLAAIVAGDQNTVSVLAKAVYTLLCSPDLWRRLVDEPGIASRLTEELIRLIPLGVSSTFPRIATRELETNGGMVHEGDVVYADAFAANRDPDVFPHPEIIDPERSGKRHLQFGYGMHHCMGAALARLQITELLTRLAREFPALVLDVDPQSLPWDQGALLRRPTSLPVRW